MAYPLPVSLDGVIVVSSSCFVQIIRLSLGGFLVPCHHLLYHSRLRHSQRSSWLVSSCDSWCGKSAHGVVPWNSQSTIGGGEEGEEVGLS